MLKERILDYFNKNRSLRVLFFFDSEQEYLEEVNQLDLENIHIEKYNNTPFTTKCKLISELYTEKVFLYLSMSSPSTQEDYHNFPLMGLLLANKELKLDNVGEFMERYGLQRHQKNLASKFIQELKYTTIQKVCEPILTPGNFNEPAIIKALLSAFLKFKSIQSWSILSAKLITLTGDNDTTILNRVIKKIKTLNIEDEILIKLNQNLGYTFANLSIQELHEAARSVLYNSITQNISLSNSDPYKKLKLEETSQITQLNQMLFEIERHPKLSEDFNRLMEKMGDYIRAEKLIEVYGIEADFAVYTNEMLWQIILDAQLDVKDSPKAAIKKLETISLQQDLLELEKNTINFLIQTSNLHQSINKIESYVLNKPEEYIHKYTTEWFLVDKLYRKSIFVLKSIDTTEIPDKLDLELIQSELNSEYENHITTLNREWLACLNQFKFDYHKINVPKQYDFYNTEIAHQEQKVVVIISDALRYEVGESLLGELHADTKNTAVVRHMLASIPSKTNIGMAQLLPRKTVAFNNGDIKINDILNSGKENRTKILNTFKDDSCAISYQDLDGISQEKGRAIFKNSLVYIYHDVIDATGDKRTSERSTFKVSNDAVDELKLLVKKLHNSFNVSKVFVTADHGFIYNDREVQEKEKEKIPDIKTVQTHNRYFLTEQSINPDLGYCLPLNTTTIFEENIFVNIPSSVNRYLKQGVGHQFVHGGASLQELVVPVIESSYKRENVAKKVMPVLIHKGVLKVVSNILRINVLQENEVARFEKSRTIKIGLYNENELVSNEHILELNSTSETPSERLYRVELTLASDSSSEPLLKLKVFDIEDDLNPLIEERVQNNTIIPTDF